MRDFSEWIRQYDMVDLPMGGARYTWTKKQMDLVMCVPNRFLDLLDWVDLFPDCLQLALPWPISNHCPTSLVTGLEDQGPTFRLEIMWLKEKSSLASVPEWWQEMSISGWMGFQLFQKF